MRTIRHPRSLHQHLMQITLFSALFLFPLRSTALEHTLTFTGSGTSTTVDSVLAQNITRGLAVTVPAGKTLKLSDEPNAIYSVEDNEYQISIYPNPIQGTSTLSFYSPVSGQTKVDVLALDGRRIDGTTNNIEAGENLYKLSLPKGAYFIKITGSGFSYAVRVLSQRPNDYTTEISFTGNNGMYTNKQKSPAAFVSLFFNAGDRLLMRGYSGNNSNIITDIPTESKTIPFEFVECKDATGNHYATVKIGTQTWMAENLNATQYQGGEQITEVKDDAAWKALTTGAYCDNSNNAEYAKIYGKLYNWYAVNDTRKIAPKGWHVPTSQEWTTLIDYLGGSTLAGGKLKQTGTSRWASPNTAATNETGFSALPGGWRNYEGVSLTPGTQAGWWTNTPASATHAMARRVVSNLGTILIDNSRENQMGYGIRCIKDEFALPTISTTSVTSVTHNSAYSGGTITNDGGAPVTVRGVCWSTSPNPTIANSKTTDGTGTGTFSSSITGLSPLTTYYVRAYATNIEGTAYGNEVSFTTSAVVTTVVDVINPVTGKTWMDRNLGARRAATSSTDVEAYGDLYQWGRGTDGHEKRTSGTTIVLSTSDNPGHRNFIKAPNSPFDWRNPQNDNLWQGLEGVNNPCPNGYRLPTETEWVEEINSWSSKNSLGAFNSTLKLPVAGLRSFDTGAINYIGASGFYLSSSVKGVSSLQVRILSGGADLDDYTRAAGRSIRCLKNQTNAELPSVLTTSVTEISPNSATFAGNISNDGGVSVTSRGVCWSTNPNPTLANSKTTDGAGIGLFTSLLTGLTANTKYYVRAYATNIIGTGYGNEVSFSTTTLACGAYTAPGVWKEFLCHNLGANTSLDPMTYSDGINGDLYQWGRPADGHQLRTSATTSNLSTSNSPGHDKFIINSNTPYDWRSGGGNDNRWSDAAKAANDPCPTGYKVPTKAEWAGVVANNSKSSWASGYKFGEKLFLPASGSRGNGTGSMNSVGFYGYYWSSSVNNTRAFDFYFNGVNINVEDSYYRALGFSVRCIAEEVIISIPTINTNVINNIASTSATSGGVIINDGGAAATTHGVCWSLNPNPTVSLSTKTVDVSGAEAFMSSITGLTPGTTYYVRAYATNSAGTAYGNEIRFTTNTFTTEIIDVINPITGRTWMDRNLGASRAATSSTDSLAYGDLYQWGRGADGHEHRNSVTTSSLSNSDEPGHGNFVTLFNSPYDWRDHQNDNLWQGINGKNNPCPSGYRLPTQLELESEMSTWGSLNALGAITSHLKMPLSGYRSRSGLFYYQGLNGYYWTSSVDGSNSIFLSIVSSGAGLDKNNRSSGKSVRCIKVDANASLPTLTTTSIIVTTTNYATSGGFVVSDGGEHVISRGVCWSTSINPTINDSKSIDGSGSGAFISSLTNLLPSTTYYVRAYATNSIGTSYGDLISFTTKKTELISWIDIPAGTFDMGSSDNKQHSVILSSFKISKYEISNIQFAEFLNEKGIKGDGLFINGLYPSQILISPSSGVADWGLHFKNNQWVSASGYENHPVIYVSWYGAFEFSKWVGGELPTESQWEYVCRAGSKTPFNTGNCLDNTQANYQWQYPYNSCVNTNIDSPNSTQPVGTYPANLWGVCEMHGNVDEWCNDWYQEEYPVDIQTDPKGPISGTLKVQRGGNYSTGVNACLSARRSRNWPDDKTSILGFRVISYH
jgi:uncharacterized protein (TIGR02145 family)